VAAVIVVALIAAIGAWWWTNRDTAIRLGDYGEVTATVNDTSCGGLMIEVEGLRLVNKAGALPAHWHGASIRGDLELDARRGEDGVQGTFTAYDGTDVLVYGGVAGEYFFTLGCPISS